MSENLFYHYTKAETAINYILKNLTIRMGRLASVNDPRESKYRNFTFYSMGVKSAIEFDGSLFDDVCADLALNSYAFCCVKGSGDEGALHPHMWANYADDHKGVCLIFDSDKIDVAIKQAVGEANCFEGEVEYVAGDLLREKTSAAHHIYVEHWLADTEGFFDDHVRQYWKQLFFVKHTDWRDEKEYRWVARSREGKDIFVDISGAVIGCVVGEGVKDEDFYTLVAMCEALHISLRKVVWNGSGSLTRDFVGRAGIEDKCHLNVEMSYSLNVPSKVIFTRVSNGDGGMEVLSISCANGNVVWGGNALGAQRHLELLGYTNDDLIEKVVVGGFSAARFSEWSQRPGVFLTEEGVIKVLEEDIPYYGVDVAGVRYTRKKT